MNILLRRIIDRIVKTGNLKITSADGKSHHFGDGGGDAVHLRFNTARAERAVALHPTLALAETFMDGDLDFVEGDVLAFLHLVYINVGPGVADGMLAHMMEGMRVAVRGFQQINTAGRSKRNVQRHYDLSGEIYKLFLDEDMQYSCAYFERPDMTLEEAQLAKKRHIAAKMRLKPGQSVLDIGCGWGGMALYLAKSFEADVLGVTLSTEQHAVATERAREQGLENKVHFEIRDYRSLSERFDRIVSVGMFEHVGVNYYRAFFDKCKTLLKPDGVMLLHYIGRSGPPSATNAFIRKYIFPGGYIPSLSEVMPHVERAGLIVTDIEVLRLHYAETLKNWRERFLANRERAKEIYDERFCRMWEFYLSGSEAAFRWQDLVIFQIQISKKNDVVPLTRNYIDKAEKSLGMHEIAHGIVAQPVPQPKPKRPKKVSERD